MSSDCNATLAPESGKKGQMSDFDDPELIAALIAIEQRDFAGRGPANGASADLIATDCAVSHIGCPPETSQPTAIAGGGKVLIVQRWMQCERIRF